MSTSGAGDRRLTTSEQEWLRVRAYLQEHRHELSAVAAERYPGIPRVAGTPLLARPAWRPDLPLPLTSVTVDRAPDPGRPAVLGTEEFTEPLRPTRPDGTRYAGYSEAMAELAAPRVFRNRSTYRLRSAELRADPARTTFGTGSYFDGIDVGEACAHELAAAVMGLSAATPLRDAIGDPCDPARRPTNLAVSTLTLRHDRTGGDLSFPLHWRDPAKVGHAGGLYMVMPVGIFQAASDRPEDADNDFSLWRCMLREFAEELLGEPEEHEGPVDYDRWPFAARMAEGLHTGAVRAHVLGLGVDPLTLATDLLTVVTVDSRLYDELFGAVTEVNAEGRLLRPAQSPTGRWPLSEESVTRLTTREPMQAAGAALLRLARDHAGALR